MSARKKPQPQKSNLSGYYNVNDVMQMLCVKQCKAYMVIKELNNELVAKGYMVGRAGLVPKKYFHERFYCDF